MTYSFLQAALLMLMERRQMADIRPMGTYPQCTVHIHSTKDANTNDGQSSLYHPLDKSAGVLGLGNNVSALCPSHEQR